MKHKNKNDNLGNKKRCLAILLSVIVLSGLFIPLYVTADTVSDNDIVMPDNSNTVSDNDIALKGDGESASNYDEAILEKRKEQNYYIYKAQLDMQLMEQKLKYLEGVKEECKEKLIIEEKKLELGYTTPVEVEETRNQCSSIQMQIDEARDLKEFYGISVILYGGQKEEIEIFKEWVPLNDDYISKYKENNSQIEAYQEQIDKYKTIIQLVGPEVESVSIYEKQLQTAELNLTQYEVGLELYVRQLQLQHENLGRKVEETDNKISVAETKINNMRLLLEKGKVTKIELMELENELINLKYERMDFLCDAMKISYILENTLKNQTL